MARFGTLILCAALAAGSGVAAAQLAAERERVTAALDRVSSLAPDEARREAATLERNRPKLAAADRLAADLVAAAALERAGDVGEATRLYSSLQLAKDEAGIGMSARFRYRLLTLPNQNADTREDYFETVRDEPPVSGWFRRGQGWEYMSSVRAALYELVALRSDRLSFKLFDFLGARSTFPRHYNYLFILLLLAAGVKILALPLHIRLASISHAMRQLRPEIQAIQRIHAGDPVETQRQLAELYRARGINFAPGCAAVILDLIFVVWALITFSGYAPQMALDEARFWNVTDVSQPSSTVLWLWLGLGVVSAINMAVVQRVSPAQAFGGAIFSGLLFTAIAWYWEWPAYVLIFWGTLTLLGITLNLILLPFTRPARSLTREAL